jgi:hypothetical protein
MSIKEGSAACGSRKISIKIRAEPAYLSKVLYGDISKFANSDFSSVAH